MALSDWSRKFSNSITQKAKDISEISALKGQVSAEQKKLESYYQNLGKLYYEHSAEYPVPELEELVRLIGESQKKIEELNSQVSTIENARVCPKCGARIEEGMVYCIGCGARLEDLLNAERQEHSAQTSEERFCINCGAKVPAKAAFCTKCGTRQ